MGNAVTPRGYGTGPLTAHALAGVAAAAFLLVCASPVVAQTLPADSPMQSAAPVGADGLRENGFYLEADQVEEDRSGTRRIIARGNVQARYQGRTLRADEIVYETETGVVTARGSAQIINPDGTVQYADEIQLDEDLRAGVATGFAARLEQNGKLAAASAIRRSETVNELNKAIFTPCDICTEDGKPKTPSWDIRADKVVQDQDNNVVYYRNAQVRLFGVPVLYAPVFWHPDPSAERSSGFLMPEVALTDKRGLSYQQPYLWVISPSQELEISPQINTEVNPLLNLDWRKRFWSGSINARAGYTYEQDFDDDGDKFGESKSRGYILADGRFAIDRNWRWGFAVERTSDDTFFDRYDIGGVYQERGLYLNDSRRLLSQVYTVRQSQRSYLSIAALSFQSLRFVDPSLPTVRENDDALPVVAPIVEGRWEPEGEVAGGRLRVFGSAVAIEREEQFLNPFAPSVPGADSRRATVEADWRRAFTTTGGVRIEPFLTARGDAYDVEEVYTPLGSPWVYTVRDPGGTTRGNVTAGVDLRYPLMRRTETATVVIEPMAQFAASPESERSWAVPNEDSLVVEVDDTNLFRANRFPGYDLYEGGPRATVGAQATITWDGGREARGFIGRTFRTEREESFPASSGFRDKTSDWVVSASFTPLAGVDAWTRARIDDSGSVRRGEAGVDWRTSRTSGYMRYLLDDAEPFTLPLTPQRGRREDLEAGGEVLVTGNWGFTFRGNYDARADQIRRSEIGLLYQDECLRLELVYERNRTRVGALAPSESVFLRLNLATLGAAGYRDDDRW